jgi:hypothetical protein
MASPVHDNRLGHTTLPRHYSSRLNPTNYVVSCASPRVLRGKGDTGAEDSRHYFTLSRLLRRSLRRTDVAAGRYVYKPDRMTQVR